MITYLMLILMLVVDIILMFFNFGKYFSYSTRTSSLFCVVNCFVFAKSVCENCKNKEEKTVVVKQTNGESSLIRQEKNEETIA